MLLVFKGKHLKEAAEARRCWLMSIGVDLSLNIINMLKLQPTGASEKKKVIRRFQLLVKWRTRRLRSFFTYELRFYLGLKLLPLRSIQETTAAYSADAVSSE